MTVMELSERVAALTAERDRLAAELAAAEQDRDKLQAERNEARARVHLGHSGPYADCLRRPCIGWHAHDKAAEHSATEAGQ